MKKAIVILAIATSVASLDVSAQAPSKPTDSIPVFSIADSASFTGKYKYEGLPFDYMEVSVQAGKLYFSGGEYAGALAPMKDKKDVFDAGGVAVFTFLRNSTGKVSELQIDYQGSTFTGTRQMK